MFHDIPKPVLSRMSYLEELDRKDRIDGTPRSKRLRQVPPETGRFIALLATFAPKGNFIEIGTSAGYSALWLVLACQTVGCTLTTFEVLEEKAKQARETFRKAEIEEYVTLVQGDALSDFSKVDDLSFCFLDAEKEIYMMCYEAVVPKLLPGGLLIADNAINHETALRPMLDRAFNDDRVDALVVPIGKGVLVCRKL